MTSVADLKRAAAEAAVDEVEDGMILGLGTGSTVARFLEVLARRIRDGELTDVRGVPTSVQTATEAHSMAIPLTNLDDDPVIHLTVDGADEVDLGLDLIKGLGGALLREKVVAQASERLIIIADETKLVERLGIRAPVPVETLPFAMSPVRRFVEELGAEVTVREEEADTPYRTDNGNFVLDCRFADGLDDPDGLDRALKSRAGVVETGLFLGMADTALVGTEDGVRTLRRPTEP
ncbi:MAG: ribose 5-phosphate isomerase A [Longimicrobiales bacterium]|nr:ribose 5-phosphate isomerase A [Longimicrobiales bacterium]